MRNSRRLRQALGGPFAVDEIELVFDRDDRRQAERRHAFEHGGEYVARITEEGPPVRFVHRNLQLREWVFLPGNPHQAARDGVARAVGVAVVEAETGRLHGAAEDVEREHRSGQQHAAAVGRFDAGAIEPLAAFDRVQVVHEHVEVPRFGVRLEEAREFGAGVAHHESLV